MKNQFLFALMAFALISAINAQAQLSPSFEQVLSLKSISNPEISPDGNNVVYEMRAVDWKKNRYDTEIWLSKAGNQPFQLTNSLKNSSSNPKWSPNGKWIAFMTTVSKKNQIHIIRAAGGESFQLTNTKNNISTYEWSPDGNKIAFLQSEDKSEEEKNRKEIYGG